MIRLCLMVLLAGTALGTSCSRPAQTPSSPAVDPGEPVQAQPKLQTLKLWLGAEEMAAELALTAQQVRTGMMFRTGMEENEGMLFVFSMPHQASFWMKNTIVPLSVAYIDLDGLILEIHDMQPQNTNAVTAGSERVQFVLETKQGWFKRHNVREGMVVRTERGTLAETFFRKQ